MITPAALTMGDPSGICGEIGVAAWQKRPEGMDFFWVADPDWVRTHTEPAGVAVRVISDPAEATGANALPVLPCPLAAPAVPGQPDPANAAAIIASIERAVALCRTGQASAVVTNPINKKGLKDGAGFAFPGHTEFLAHLAGVQRSVMMLTAPELRVVPVTIHVALEAVKATLTPALLEETLRIAHAALRTDFGLANPRIAVAGLNPHAGEGGAMGREEIEIITPVLDRLRAEGMSLSGPLSADTMFHARARDGYDVAVCMYHDQALIPIKTLNFDAGVNVTLGLPFIRTSPDHGTAYDIAGQGLAQPTSLIEALRLAHHMATKRAA